MNLSVNFSSTYSTAEDRREKAKSPDAKPKLPVETHFVSSPQILWLPYFGCTFEVGRCE